LHYLLASRIERGAQDAAKVIVAESRIKPSAPASRQLAAHRLLIDQRLRPSPDVYFFWMDSM
jgi:hypothetical protein